MQFHKVVIFKSFYESRQKQIILNGYVREKLNIL